MADGFDPDDFDFELDLEDGDDDCTILRATFKRGGEVSMWPWSPGLAESGPSSMHFRARERAGVAIADLRLIRNSAGEREVIAEFMSAGRAREAAEAALCRWAGHAGHDRVWLPSGPVDVEPCSAPSTAVVRCRVCRAKWMDSSPGFWDMVHNLGHFPMVCPTCAHPLPQWTVHDTDLTRCHSVDP